MHYNLGDEIELNVGKRVDTNNTELNQNSPYKPTEVEEKIIDTTSKKYKVVGLVERPALSIEKYSAPGYTLITYIDATNINGNADLYVRYTKDGLKTLNETTSHILGVNPSIFGVNKEHLSGKDLEKYEKEMAKAKYEIDTNMYLISLETHPIQNSGLGPVVFIVIGIIIVTSVVCIKNSFDISITEKIKQYGILRSIGATKKQIKKNVFFEASSLGLIGIPLGIIFGLLVSYILILISNTLLRDELADGFKLLFGISFISIAVSIVLGIVTIYFSAFRGARKASKVSPIDSIRNSANIKINPKKIKSPRIIKKLNIPTIFLTAKDEEDDIVKGLNIGAEDYITKPFSTKELLARINKILLRSKKSSIIKVKNISFDMDKLVLSKDDTPIELSALELKIVNLLFTNINKVVSRNVLLDKIWEWTGNDVDDHTITVYLKRIREKIGTDIIITIKGMGYRIDEE